MSDEKLPFDVVDSGAPSQFFVDGYNGILTSSANSKITFYQTVGVDRETKRELRKMVLTLVMPTEAMSELCKKFLKASVPVSSQAVSKAGKPAKD